MPNTIIAYGILLTIPISVATAQRSFSKLQIVKNYLRNRMLQNKLSDLAIISIEKDVVNMIDFTDIIEEFARSKAKKIH